MLVAGLPYSFTGQSTMEEISGGTPYGASVIAGTDGSKAPNKYELDGARYQGRHVAELLARMK
jgi:NAD(P)H dehydrogenase (quinone)